VSGRLRKIEGEKPSSLLAESFSVERGERNPALRFVWEYLNDEEVSSSPLEF